MSVIYITGSSWNRPEKIQKPADLFPEENTSPEPSTQYEKWEEGMSYSVYTGLSSTKYSINNSLETGS